MAMTGIRRVSTGLGLVEKTPPRAVAEQAPLIRGLLKRLPPDRRDEAIELAHWTYGAIGGVGYATLPQRIRMNRWSGVAYGLAVWAIYEAGVVPVLGLEHVREKTIVSRALIAADHALYGAVLGGAPWHARV